MPGCDVKGIPILTPDFVTPLLIVSSSILWWSAELSSNWWSSLFILNSAAISSNVRFFVSGTLW